MIRRLLTQAEKVRCLEIIKDEIYSWNKSKEALDIEWSIIEAYTKDQLSKSKIADDTIDDICEDICKALSNAQMKCGRTVGADYAAVFISNHIQNTFKSFQPQKTGQTGGAQISNIIDQIRVIINTSSNQRYAKSTIHILGNPNLDDIMEYRSVLLYTTFKSIISKHKIITMSSKDFQPWQEAFIRINQWNSSYMTTCLRLYMNKDEIYSRRILLSEMCEIIHSIVKIGGYELKLMWKNDDNICIIDIYCDERPIHKIGSTKPSEVFSGIDPVSKYLNKDVYGMIITIKISGIEGLYDMWPERIYIPKYLKSIINTNKRCYVTFDFTALDQVGVYYEDVTNMMNSIFNNKLQIKGDGYIINASKQEIQSALNNEDSITINELNPIIEGDYLSISDEMIDNLGIYMNEILNYLPRTSKIISKNTILLGNIIDINDISSKKVITHTLNSRREHWYLIAKGSAYRELAMMPFVDFRHTTTSNIKDVYSVLGIEAAYIAVKNGLRAIDPNTNNEIITLIASVITCIHVLTPIIKSGLTLRNNGRNVSELLSSQGASNNLTKFTSGGIYDDLTGTNGCIINGLLPKIGDNLPGSLDKYEYYERLLTRIS